MWILLLWSQSEDGSSDWAKIVVRLEEIVFKLYQLLCATHNSFSLQSFANFLHLDLKVLEDMREHEI